MVGVKQTVTPFNLEPWDSGNTWDYSNLGITSNLADAQNIGLYYSTVAAEKKHNFRSFTPPVRKDGQLKGYMADLQTNFSGKQFGNVASTDRAYLANAGSTSYGMQMTRLNDSDSGDLAVKRNGLGWWYPALASSSSATWLTGQSNITYNYNLYRATNGINIVKDQVGNMYMNGQGIYRNGDGGSPGTDAKSAVGGG